MHVSGRVWWFVSPVYRRLQLLCWSSSGSSLCSSALSKCRIDGDNLRNYNPRHQKRQITQNAQDSHINLIKRREGVNPSIRIGKGPITLCPSLNLLEQNWQQNPSLLLSWPYWKGKYLLPTVCRLVKWKNQRGVSKWVKRLLIQKG